METIKLQRKLNMEYSMVQGLYWTLYCILLGFASVFLLDKGYTNSQIGVILAIGFLGSVVLQQFVAILADKTKKISLITIIILCVFCLTLCCTGLMLTNAKSTILSLMFVFALIFMMLIQPLVNSLNFYLEKIPVKINFGVARSMGSLLFAIASMILGTAIERIHAGILPVCAVVISVCMILVLLCISHDYRLHCTSRKEEKTTSPVRKQSIIQFFCRYRMFFLFLIGGLGIFFGHTLINNYLFQITVSAGGDSQDLGGLQSVSALLELPAMIFFDQLRKRFGCIKLLKLSSVFFLIKIGITLFAGSIPLLYTAALCQTLAFAVFIPGSVHFVDETMLPEDAVKGQAFVTGMITLANLLSSLCGGVLLDQYNVFYMLAVGTIVTLFGAVSAIYALSRIQK